MTLAAAPAHARHDDGTTPTATVTAVLLLRDAGPWLAQTLDALAAQTRPPERLVVVDTGGDGEAVEAVRAHRPLADAVGQVRFVTVAGEGTRGDLVGRALAELGPPARDGLPPDEHDLDQHDPDQHRPDRPTVEHLWLLTSDCAADERALARLLDAVRRSPSVAAAGPKLVRWDHPGSLDSVGLQLTRAGRVIPSPVPGEPDQGQYDRRTDVLAVPFTGLLVERDLLESLGGHEPAFGEYGGDIDLAWRAHQAGRRVIVVPRATVRTGAAPEREPQGSRRRAARRVALARCAPVVAPFLGVWVALSSVAVATVLLLAKQPRAAWAELGDVGAVVDPWRVLSARWRSRGGRSLRRRDLAGLFVRPGAAVRHATDLVHDQVFLHTDPADRPHTPVEALESGPVSDEAMDLQVLSASWAARAARNPGVLAVALATVLTLVAGRSLPGGLVGRLQTGLAGGELVGVRATSSTLWHAWLDPWHGAGLGRTGEQGPHLAVLAGLAWVAEHLPWDLPLGSSVGAAVATLLGLALPLSTLAAYLAARVVTHARWPRALAALAWSTTAVVGTAVGGGRLGAVVAAVLLPLVAAGFVLAARRESGVAATAATAVGAAVLAAFVPALLVAVAVAATGLVLLGRGRARLRGLALLVLPPALLGPWLSTLVETPHLLLVGPGLAVWGGAAAEPWQIALGHPGGPGSHPVLFTAPLVLAGVAGLLRGGRRSAAGTVLALAALVGLAAALAAPRVRVGTVPEGLSGAGEPITAWAGTGLLLYLLALVAAALLGATDLPVRRAEGGWAAVARWPVAAAVVGAVLASGGWTAWKAVGAELSVWTDPRPAVAVDQAEGPLAGRMLLLEPSTGEVAYQLLGREVGDVARSLPATAQSRPKDPGVARAVALLFEQGSSPEAPQPAAALAAQGIGFVGVRAADTDPSIRTLDAVAGLSRLGVHDGVAFWRVLDGGDEAQAPSRARLEGRRAPAPLDVSGDHGRTVTTVPAGAAYRLVVAEPAAWAGHARVSLDGRELTAARGAGQPTYALPAGGGRLAIDLPPTHERWRWAQLALLAGLAFLAVPLGGRARRNAP